MKLATLRTPSSVYMVRTPFSNIPQWFNDPKGNGEVRGDALRPVYVYIYVWCVKNILYILMVVTYNPGKWSFLLFRQTRKITKTVMKTIIMVHS